MNDFMKFVTRKTSEKKTNVATTYKQDLYGFSKD